jgi:hypothetical protein
MFRASSCPSSGATTAVAASGLPSELGDKCCRSWLGQLARPRPTALLPPRSNGKPEAATAAVELLMMGMRMPETCWAVFKRQVINLINCCIWLVVSFEWLSVWFHSLFTTTITYAFSILYKGKCCAGIILLPFPGDPVIYVISLPSLHVVMLLQLQMKMKKVDKTNKNVLV